MNALHSNEDRLAFRPVPFSSRQRLPLIVDTFVASYFSRVTLTIEILFWTMSSYAMSNPILGVAA